MDMKLRVTGRARTYNCDRKEDKNQQKDQIAQRSRAHSRSAAHDSFSETPPEESKPGGMILMQRSRKSKELS